MARLLHDDHIRTITILERLEGVLNRLGVQAIPDVAEARLTTVLDDLIGAVEGEIGGHFTFEEDALFPRIAEAGDGALTALLVEEHQTILPLARKITELARNARRGEISAESWQDFFVSGRELIERMMAHIQKEEMGVLPLLDDILDSDSDGDLSMQYAMER